MTRTRRRLIPGETVLSRTLAAIRTDLGAPGPFPPDALAELTAVLTDPARWAVDGASVPGLPRGRDDDTDVDFVTIDPPGSTDLDQAVHLVREGRGYRVRYAIADVAAFVPAGGPLDAETRARGQTYYLPDGRIPLHPTQLSEDAASLLPGRDRPAYVWDLHLDAQGLPAEVTLRRSTVRSRAQLDYAGVQAELAGRRASVLLTVLAEVGRLRIEAEADRGGASLPKPEQEVYLDSGRYRLRFRPHVPAEEYNAQISLLTGMAAAQLMLTGGVGVLRTMPRPAAESVDRLRRQAEAMGVAWPVDQPYGSFLRGLSRDEPQQLAVMHAATSLFRGAGYTAFHGAPPPDPVHAAIAAPYAHVTAPLRRLADRFALVVCLALAQHRPVPDWAVAVLPTLPDVMAASDRRASALDRACTDAVEAAVLAGLVGQELPAMVIENRADKGLIIQVSDPAVVARCTGTAAAGERIRARVVEADPRSGRVRFAALAQ